MKSSVKEMFCIELANCLIEKDMDKYDYIYEIARKSAPSCFSSKNKCTIESYILQIYMGKLRKNNLDKDLNIQLKI